MGVVFAGNGTDSRPSTQYAKLDSDITMLHAKLKTVLFNKMDAILNNPIHSDQGLSNLLKDGIYLTPNPSKSSLQLGAREVAQLTVMSELFKSLVSSLVNQLPFTPLTSWRGF